MPEQAPKLNPNHPFEDPAAAAVWAAVCALPEGAQHEVCNRLVERLALVEQRATAQEVRVARGVAALREAADILGHSPTVGQYRELRDKHPECRWPDDSSIRGWLSDSKSWNEALRAARLDAVPDPHPVSPRGPDLTDEEIVGAVRECAADLGKAIADLSWSEYLRWSKRAEVRRRPGRRPRSQGPFDRLGGFLEVKRRALGADAEGIRMLARRDGTGYRYTDEEIFAAAAEIVARLDPDKPWPTGAEWARERKAILQKERDAGLPPRAIPSSNAVWRRFRSWEEARWAYERARRESQQSGTSGSPEGRSRG